MARRKPVEQLSPAYRARIERAQARGLSRSEARGHGPQGTEYGKRTRGAAVRSVRRNPYMANGRPADVVDAYLSVYTVAGLVPVLRAQRAAQDAYSVFRRTRRPEDAEVLEAAKLRLHAAHDRYRRKRRASRSLPYAPRDVEEIGDDLYEVDIGAAYEGHEDYDSILLFYH